jgi:transcriptional antiterminator NusG
MILGELESMFKKINFVAGFLGEPTPIALRESEVNRILGKMDELAHIDEIILDNYIVGETVKIVDGPFTTFVGKITDVFSDKKRIKMIVKVFGRETPIELKYEQVSKEI